MPHLNISHHERVEGHPHRWHVYLHGRPDPIPVELHEEERRGLAMRAAGHPWRHLSMGMSNDYPVAIEEGATLVRVGRAIFGERGG